MKFVRIKLENGRLYLVTVILLRERWALFAIIITVTFTSPQNNTWQRKQTREKIAFKVIWS